jgi:tRNA nucleotidyltransferase (CCA-adding enzyme)
MLLPHHKSCGVILYREGAAGIEFLLLFQKGSQTWSFPKGHAEACETEQETALREIKEETGLAVNLAEGFRVETTYPMHTCAGTKTVALFLAKAPENTEIRIKKDEIETFVWARPEEAKRLLRVAYFNAVDEACRKLFIK